VFEDMKVLCRKYCREEFEKVQTQFKQLDIRASNVIFSSDQAQLDEDEDDEELDEDDTPST
jgi:hypothetical protein